MRKKLDSEHLLPWQLADVGILQRLLKKHRSVVYQLTTGGGKTVVAARIIQQAEAFRVGADLAAKFRIGATKKLRGLTLPVTPEAAKGNQAWVRGSRAKGARR